MLGLFLLLFRQAVEVLDGLQGIEIPVFDALRARRVNGSCDCDGGAPLAGSAQSLVRVFQFLPQFNCHPYPYSPHWPILSEIAGLR